MTDRKTYTTQLAKDTFEALAPWLNIFGCGFEDCNVPHDEEPHPAYMITQECARLYARAKAGETDLHYDDGGPFEKQHFGAGILRAGDVRDCLHGQKLYDSGGRDGQTITTLDIEKS